MPASYNPGDVLGRGQLSFFLEDESGNPTNASEISYAISFVSVGPPETETVVGPSARVPVNPTVGEYFGSLQIPSNAQAGTYRVRWRIRRYPGHPLVEIVEEFTILSLNPQATTNPLGLTVAEKKLIDSLRILLRDWNPDRHYHFNPPEHESQIGQYNRVFGFVWEDLELREYLRMALDTWNMFPPNTAASTPSLDAMLQNRFTSSWGASIKWGAIASAMFALTRNWIQDEFSIGGEVEVTVYLPDGQSVSLPVEELYEICHGQ